MTVRDVLPGRPDRHLRRSHYLKGGFGFEPQNTLTVGTNRAMAGYRNDQVTDLQKRMIHAIATIPDVGRAGE